MDIKKLKDIFPSLITVKTRLQNENQYEWFDGPNGERFGIKKAELTERETTILKLFSQAEQLPKKTEREELWYQILFKNKQFDLELEGVRFVFFYTNKEVKDIELFNEAIKALSPSPIIWFTRESGVIIEEIKTKKQMPAKFEESVDLMMSDLYVQVSFFVGEIIKDFPMITEYFKWYQQLGEIHRQKGKGKVVYVQDILTTYIVNKMDKSSKILLPKILLKEAISDNDLLKTIRVYLDCNSNVTEAAKKMYLHRNSLQYRIDKFIEITNIDIKSFQGAFTTYILLQMLEEK